jgi:DNA repair exonuclease SbcCD ATPase subunit
MADVQKDIVLRVKSETDQATGQFKNLKQELRSIENELNKMAAAGQTGTEAFKKLQQRAGEVKDQVGDTKAAIKALSSDTFRLDAFAQGAQAIAGGFAAAQGAMALFGSENKQIEEAIKKTQGAMALLQGVTAITNVLQKESALRLAIATTAQTAYTAVVGASSGAMKIFRLALASTGIGALVVGLGLLIANFDDVKKVVMNLLKPFDGIIAKVRDFLSVISFGLIDNTATKKTKENAEQVVEAFNKTKDAMKENEKVIERRIELAKAEGKGIREIYLLEKQLADLRVKNLKIEQDGLKLKEQAGNATEDEKKRIKELTTEIADATNKRLILDANFKKAVADANQKAEEKRREKERENNTAFFKDLGELKTKEVGLIQNTTQEEARSLLTLNDLKKQSNEVDAQLAQQRKQHKMDEISSGLRLASMGLDSLMQLTTAFTKNTEESQRKAFKINKSFQIAQALIQTYQAVTGALTAGGNPIKLATGAQFVEAGIALTAGLANVAKIAKTQFGGGSQGAGGAGGGVGSVPQPSAMATTTPTIGSTQLQLDAQGNLQQQSVRTYVLETDISEKQKRSQRLQRTATLGK